MEKYAKVIVDISVDSVDRLFSYILPIEAVVGQRVLVPFGNRKVEGFILEISTEKPEGDFELKTVIKVLEDYAALDETQISLAYWMKTAYHCTMAQVLRQMIPAQLRGMRVKEKKVRTIYLNPEFDKTSINALKQSKKKDIIQLLADSTINVAVADIVELVPNAYAPINALVKDGIVIEKFETVYRKPNQIAPQCVEKPVLTAEQETALQRIEQIIDEGKQKTVLLHGITGSGKTEVYMQAIEYVLSKKRGAIVLVPEISLTPQTVARFVGRFGDSVAVLHSRLSAGERFDEWRRIRLNQVSVVVGARSAVFAPISDLGIIVIDEEHEDSYSSENPPRYNASEVAQRRCSYANAPLILGSATPKLTSYYYAKSGKYELLELNNRVNLMPLPQVSIVDMRKEFVLGNTSIFSGLLTERLRECIDAGEQAILFVNRRGYSSFVMCRACGEVIMCPDCDVSLTYHKQDNSLKCHYCGIEQRIPKTCPKCSKPYLKYMGIGTQQVQEEFISLFPNTKYLRMDADSTRGKDSHADILGAFASKQAQVLIGTQMIAKGLDFPNVTLVGIVLADCMLNIPDYRNTERAFSLITQVAGRAGRAEKVGSVVIQTNTPENNIIKLAVQHDYKNFYEAAIHERANSLYPPFSLFVRILFTGDEQEILFAESQAFADACYATLCETLLANSADCSEILFMYAMPAPIKRIKEKYRQQVLIKLARTKHTSKLIKAIYAYSDTCDMKHLYSIEINPNDMM